MARAKSHVVSKNAWRSARSGKKSYENYSYRYLSFEVGIALTPTYVAHVSRNGGFSLAYGAHRSHD